MAGAPHVALTAGDTPGLEPTPLPALRLLLLLLLLLLRLLLRVFTLLLFTLQATRHARSTPPSPSTSAVVTLLGPFITSDPGPIVILDSLSKTPVATCMKTVRVSEE